MLSLPIRRACEVTEASVGDSQAPSLSADSDGVRDGNGSRGSIQHRGVPVPEEWLKEYAVSAEAQRLERLAADKEAVRRVQLQGFHGPAWAELSDALMRYGHTVIGAWIRTGRVFRRCREKKIRVRKPPPEGFRREDTEQLAWETVAMGLTRFQNDILATSRWDPTKGASLKTFFVGQCLIQFATVYGDWCRRAQREAALAAALASLPPEAHSPDLAEDFERKNNEAELLDRMLGRFTRERTRERTRAVVLLKREGWSQQEICEALGETEKAVEGLLRRLREKGDPR